MNKKSKSLVAVYGSLRRGFGNNDLLSTSRFLGEEWIEGNYTMYNLGFYPGVVEGSTEPNKIRVEVYEVEDDVLARLDRLEGFRGDDNPNNFYNRKVVKTSHGDTYIYFLNEDYRKRGTAHRVTSGTLGLSP